MSTRLPRKKPERPISHIGDTLLPSREYTLRRVWSRLFSSETIKFIEDLTVTRVSWRTERREKGAQTVLDMAPERPPDVSFITMESITVMLL